MGEWLEKITDELVKVRSKINHLSSDLSDSRNKVEVLEKENRERKEIERIMISYLCPEFIDGLRKKKSKEILVSEEKNFWHEYFKVSRALGWIILKTYDDPGADSCADFSQYAGFLLTEDGRALKIVHLGMYSYWEGHRQEPPSLSEVLIRKHLKEISREKIGEMAPQCLEAVKAISAE